MNDDEDVNYCVACNGSGEGMYDGSTCRSCGGSGVDRNDRDDEADFLFYRID